MIKIISRQYILRGIWIAAEWIAEYNLHLCFWDSLWLLRFNDYLGAFLLTSINLNNINK